LDIFFLPLVKISILSKAISFLPFNGKAFFDLMRLLAALP
jgi:hypothetical protein